MISTTTHEHTVNAYVSGVLCGDIVAGKPLIEACKRYASDVRTGHERGLVLDKRAANRVIDFYAAALTHTTGEYAGQPFVLYPWQQFAIWNLFGWKWVETGHRRFRDCYWSVARGNGKSPIAAGIATYMVGFDGEARAQGYTAATKSKQSRIVFEEVTRFIAENKSLQKRFTTYRDKIEVPSNYSFLEPMPSEGYSADGQIPHIIIRDEVHEWREHHRPTWEKLETGMGKRTQPLSMSITTAGSDQSDLWMEQYHIAKQVVDQANNINVDQQFVIIYEIDDDDDPLDEKVWPKANPMLEFGIIKIDHLRKEAAKAATSGSELQKFKRYYTNRQSTSVQKPIKSDAWAQGNSPLPDLTNMDCHVGFDWGWRDDLTAMAYVFPLEISPGDEGVYRTYAVKVDAWIPDQGRRDLLKEPWSSWIRDGWLRVCKGTSTNPRDIYQVFDERYDEYDIASVSVDPNNCRDFGRTVEVDYGLPLNNFRQTKTNYNEPTREFVLAVDEGRIVHGGNPLLEWCASNMATEEDTSGVYVMPSKLRSFDKIDPIVAIIMAIGAVIKMPVDVNTDYNEV